MQIATLRAFQKVFAHGHSYQPQTFVSSAAFSPKLSGLTFKNFANSVGENGISQVRLVFL